MIALLFLLLPLAALAGTIPGAELGLEFSSPLEDQYQTGQALPLKGEVPDSRFAGGQVLFNFVPRNGTEPVQVFLNLDHLRFAGYAVFTHDQSGTYDLEVYLGGAGDSRLGFAGVHQGLQIDPGTGDIRLPADFFPGVVLDAPFAAVFATGEPLILAGRVSDLLKSDGQLLWVFAPLGGGEEKRVFLPLQGDRFAAEQVFLHEESGAYQLSLYLGAAGDPSLAYLGGFPVEVRRGSGEVFLPRGFFTGIRLEQPLPLRLPVEKVLLLAGTAEDGVRSLRLELEGAETRILPVPLEAGRFSLPLRLRRAETGGLQLRLVVERPAGVFVLAGEARVEAIERPAPRLQLGALALALRPGEEAVLALTNSGDAPLEGLRYEVSGPFLLGGAPRRLEPGAGAQLRIGLEEGGSGEGQLILFSDDPQEPGAVVALSSLASFPSPWALDSLEPDPQGRFVIPASAEDRLAVLYSRASGDEDSAAVYRFSLGDGLAKGAAPTPGRADARDTWEAHLRAQEHRLARRLEGRGLPLAKRAASQPQLGDRRRFVFPALGSVPEQEVEARLVALSDRALAWVQEGTTLPEGAQVEAIVAQFSTSDIGLAEERFGLPSDVDGDGRVSFLLTPLVDAVGGLAGFYSAVSALPTALGGTGDQADLMFLSPSREPAEYRPLLVHEFQHLVNFNQHVLVRGGAAESSWLNEGLSHLAEDLVAGYAVSGQEQIIRAFLEQPSAVGLAGEALLDRRKRGAAYLFVRSLADRQGEAVLGRLVNTGLADRDNIERATGESFASLLGNWGAQLYLSGLGVFPHRRFDYQSSLLRAGSGRGFPMPTVWEASAGGAPVHGTLRPRGVALVHLAAGEPLSGQFDPDAAGGVLLMPLPAGFQPEVAMPAGQVPGVRFTRLLPGRYLAGREYLVTGQLEAPGQDQLLLRFDGADTLRFYPEVAGTEFSQVLSFTPGELGRYTIQVFLGKRGGLLDGVGSFGPVEVVAATAQTAVGEVAVLPGELLLGPAYPNPFNAAVSLPLTVPEQGPPLLVEVYDLLGQRVRRIHAGGLAPGPQVLQWDGLDDWGAAAATGVYLFKVGEGARMQVRRGLLLR